MSRKHRNRNLSLAQTTHTSSLSIQAQMQQWSGPLPHPEALERYNQIVPGSAERIIAMAEDQHDHRIEIEKRVIESNISAQKLGDNSGICCRYDCDYRGKSSCLRRERNLWVDCHHYRIGGLGWCVCIREKGAEKRACKQSAGDHKRPPLINALLGHYRKIYDLDFFSTFAQVSFSATVRLNTSRPGFEPGSTQKYPRRSN